MTLSPTDAVLNVARSLVGVEEQGGPNNGQCVRMFQKVTGNKPPDPWCASFVAFVGAAALGQQWPVTKTGGCAVLGEWANGRNLIGTEPQPGDIVLYWHASLNRFAHTGFVEFALGNGKITAIEGNTNDDGSREGWKVCRKTRTLGPKDRVIRWTGALA